MIGGKRGGSGLREQVCAEDLESCGEGRERGATGAARLGRGSAGAGELRDRSGEVDTIQIRYKKSSDEVRGGS